MKGLKDRFIFIGIGVGILFYILEAAIHVFIFHEGNLYQQIFNPNAHELWMRLFVIFIFIAFCTYVRTHFLRQKQIIEISKSQQKLADFGHLTAGIAHEIKNPLNIIYGNIQMLDMEEPDPEKKEIYLIVLQQVNRAAKIIDNLLSFVRKREHKLTDIDINLLLEKTIGLVEYEMSLENITFIRDCDKNLPTIKADSDWLAQVFLNLINNARDAINEKQKLIRSGELKIEGWKGEIMVTTRITGNMAEIIFADTGTGIPEDKAANMFKPFFTTKAEGKGTGLGLSTAKEIIERLGGKIRLENRFGEGTIFIITLPY